MTTPQERRCRAFAASSREQCKRSRIFGSRYCWHHQSWGVTLITLLFGAISGFVINVLSTKYTEKAPKLELYLNLEHLANDTVFVYPTNAAYPSTASWCELTFSVHNMGDMDASELFVRLNTHSYSSNFVHAPKWNVEEVGSFARTDEILVAMVQRGDRPIPPTFAAKLQPILINSGKVQWLGGFLTYGAIAAETKKARVHILFNNPPGVTNVFRDAAAKKYLAQFDAGIAANLETVMMKLILASTNEARVVRQGNPSARIEVVTDETNSGVTIFRTNVFR